MAVIIPMIIIWTCKRCANSKILSCCLPFTVKDIETLEKHIDGRVERHMRRRENHNRTLQKSSTTNNAPTENQNYEIYKLQLTKKNTGARHKKPPTSDEPETRELAPLLKTKTETRTSTQAKCHLCSDTLPHELLQTHYTDKHMMGEITTSFKPTSS